MEKRIYVDNAATTQVAPEVFAAMIPHFCENYGNPSSIYQEGQTAKAAIEKAREQAEEFGHAEAREIVYLFVHSVCHLLGFDHVEEDEKQEMRTREEEVMTLLDLERRP